MSSVRTSLAFAFIERYLLIGLTLVSFTLLARWLTPAQIGLYSVSLALISVAHVVRDFGLANYLIQRTTLAPDDIASALGLSMVMGLLLFTLVNAGAPLVAHFYHNASLAPIVHLISLNFLILPFSSILISLLRRDMRFNALMRINVCAGVLGTGTTLALAWSGMGTWSLALGEIVNNLVTLAGVLLAGGGHQLRRPSLVRWRAILGFGGPLTASNIITSISMDINDLVVGKVLNFTDVAIYSRAQGLMNLFHRDIMGTVRGVAYPAFARANREGKGLEQQYLASLTAVLAVAWPFYGFTALYPLDVLRLMFGPQWDLSAPLVPLFCVAGMFSATVSLVPTLMLAAGNARLMATADLIIQPVKAVAMCLVLLYTRDLMPFTVTFMVVAIVAVPYFYAFKQRCVPNDTAALLRCMLQNAVLALGTLLPALAVTLLRAPGQALPLPWFFSAVGLTAASWLLMLRLLRHPLHAELMTVLRARLPARFRPATPTSPPSP